MKFTFKNITDSEIYSSAKVLFVTGPYNIFNNIAIDEMRDRCKPTDIIPLSGDLLDDFGGEQESGGNSVVTISNNLDIDTFMKTIDMSCMNGKWFTNVNYSFLTKKQKDWINSYIKDPSDNGRLVVYCNDFKDYRLLLKNKIIINSVNIHLIQLSFPNRGILVDVVRGLFQKHNVNIEERAIELFIMRMSNSYDDYEEIINKIVVESVPKDIPGQDKNWRYTVTYDDTLEAMKGIENFVLDDFIEKLLIPLKSDKSNGRNKIYRMLSALIAEMGPTQLVNKLKFKIDDYIEFRLAINRGDIPIQVKFSVPEAKQNLGPDNKLTNLSDYTFRRMANIASQTSLKDWVYMKMILNNIKYKYDPSSYERALYSLINRSVLNTHRLRNDIGVENVLYTDINRINRIPYKEEALEFSSVTENK